MTTTSMQFGQQAISVVLNEGQLPAILSTDANGNTVLVGADESFKLFSGETVTVAGVAFSVPDGYTTGSVATPLALTSTGIDTDGTLADLANDYVNVPAGATRVMVSANVTFASNATGRRYIALEQYMQAIATWFPVTGFYYECVALNGVATPVNFNTTYATCDPLTFPRMRVSVGQSSGGALNCTPIGVTFEFMSF